MKISAHTHKSYPLLGFQKYWSGKLVYITICRWAVVIDKRHDFISDMTGGKVKINES